MINYKYPVNIIKLFRLPFIIITLLAFACNKKDDTPIIEGASLNDVLTNFGGIEIINNINSIYYKNNGINYEYEEEETFLMNPINNLNYQYNYTSVLNERKVRMDYTQLEFKFPLNYIGNATQIINDDKGSISGEYNIVSHYLGGIAPKPLYSSRLEALLKNLKMSNPIELLKDVILDKGEDYAFQNNEILIPTSVENLNIILSIDSETFMPTGASILETDYLFGDVIFEVLYEDWIEVENSIYPSTLRFKFNDKDIIIETLSDISFNPVTEGIFTLEESSEDIVYNLEQAAFGIIYSQWYIRLFATNFPFDQPFNNGALAVGNFNGSHYIGENLKLIGRPDVITWSAAIKTSQGVFLVEAPLNNRWTRSIINAVNFEYPDDDIIGGIITHSHFDHSAGLRELAFEAKKLYVAQSSVNKTIETLENTLFNILPDNLSQSQMSIEVEGVDDILYLANGEIEVHLLKSDTLGTNPHSEDMLIVYVPESETIITSDMVNTGVFMEIYNNNTVKNFDEETQNRFKNRARFLIDYINEKDLQVSKIAALHGGLTSYNSLLEMIN